MTELKISLLLKVSLQNSLQSFGSIFLILIVVTRKLMIEVLFNDFIDKEWWISIFNKVRLKVFYVYMKRVPIATKFKWPIHQTFN